jgi:hypothetical protein
MKKRFNKMNFGFNMLVVLLFSSIFSIAALPLMAASTVAGTAMSYIEKAPGMLFAGVQKEIWTDIILEGFYPKDDFMSWSRDMSELVDFNTLNLAEAGVDPDVLIDNTIYPISAATRTDGAKTIVLRTLDTESTIVRNIEAMESSYAKMESVVRGHRNALRKASIQLAAHYWAPQADGAFTPVIAATGASNGTRKILTFNDILTIRAKLTAIDADLNAFALMLNPLHEADLMAEDLKLYKEIMASGKIFGFTFFVNSQTPRFNSSTGAKVAFQAVAAPSTDTCASIFWSRDEVMKADGSLDMFAKFQDPDQKGDVFNFQKRFVALPFRSKMQAAIYSPLSES